MRMERFSTTIKGDKGPHFEIPANLAWTGERDDRIHSTVVAIANLNNVHETDVTAYSLGVVEVECVDDPLVI